MSSYADREVFYTSLTKPTFPYTLLSKCSANAGISTTILREIPESDGKPKEYHTRYLCDGGNPESVREEEQKELRALQKAVEKGGFSIDFNPPLGKAGNLIEV